MITQVPAVYSTSQHWIMMPCLYEVWLMTTAETGQASTVSPDVNMSSAQKVSQQLSNMLHWEVFNTGADGGRHWLPHS
jgi:hypothetical protein